MRRDQPERPALLYLWLPKAAFDLYLFDSFVVVVAVEIAELVAAAEVFVVVVVVLVELGQRVFEQVQYWH